MPTDRILLNKGIKRFAWALPAFFVGPSIIHFAFINKLQPVFYLILFVGIAICIAAIVLVFLGLKLIMKSLFND